MEGATCLPSQLSPHVSSRGCTERRQEHPNQTLFYLLSLIVESLNDGGRPDCPRRKLASFHVCCRVCTERGKEQPDGTLLFVIDPMAGWLDGWMAGATRLRSHGKPRFIRAGAIRLHTPTFSTVTHCTVCPSERIHLHPSYSILHQHHIKTPDEPSTPRPARHGEK